VHYWIIGQYAGKFSDTQIDGTLLKELDDAILVEEFGFKRFEAPLLMRFARHVVESGVKHNNPNP
jgi:hypothetical protein